MTAGGKANQPMPVSLDVVWQGSTGKNDARMSEISMEGCFIDCIVQGMTLGELVDFKVRLPDGPWVALQGELVQQDYPMGFGLRFTRMSTDDRGLLAGVVVAHGGVPESVDAAAASVSESVAAIPQCRRVLVADDEPLTLRTLQAIVESEGFEVVTARDGREALRILQHDADFSACIFDMMMPHLQGLDLILYMKAEQRLQKIPVGMITAERDPKVWDDSVAAGASVFLPKPFTPPQVQMLLRMLVR
jgi:CheY-like chemotaxis protein